MAFKERSMWRRVELNVETTVKWFRFHTNRCHCDYRKTRIKIRRIVLSGPESNENTVCVRIPAAPASRPSLRLTHERQRLTAATRIQFQARSCGIWGNKLTLRRVYFGFPCQFSILMYHERLVYRRSSGRHTKCTQSHPNLWTIEII